jgi:hypothetical protein
VSLLRALLVAFACAQPLVASAQTHMDKALFLELATSPDGEAWGLLLVHLKGVLAGLEAANMTLVRRGDAPLYCPPPDAVLTPEWAVEELTGYFARYPNIPDNTSIALLATFALADAFACETPAARR